MVEVANGIVPGTMDVVIEGKNKGGSLTLYIQKETPLRTRKPTGCLHQMARFIW